MLLALTRNREPHRLSPASYLPVLVEIQPSASGDSTVQKRVVVTSVSFVIGLLCTQQQGDAYLSVMHFSYLCRKNTARLAFSSKLAHNVAFQPRLISLRPSNILIQMYTDTCRILLHSTEALLCVQKAEMYVNMSVSMYKRQAYDINLQILL